MLRQVAAVLRDNVCDTGLVTGLAGEEFVIALGDTDPDDAHRTCDLLRARVATFPWASLRPGLAVTISIGVVQAADQASRVSTIRERRDRRFTGMTVRRRGGHRLATVAAVLLLTVTAPGAVTPAAAGAVVVAPLPR